MSANHKRGAGGGSASGTGAGRGSQSPAQHPPLTDRSADKGKQPAKDPQDEEPSPQEDVTEEQKKLIEEQKKLETLIEEQKKLSKDQVRKKVDLPPGAFCKDDGSDTEFTKRPGYNNSQVAEVELVVNMYPVTKLPEATKVVYQFSVSAEPNKKDSKTLAKRLWDTETVQNWLKHHSKKLERWIYDGRAMAWSLDRLPEEVKIPVILPKQQQKASTGKGGKDTKPPDKYNLIIKPTTSFSLDGLDNYLSSKPNSKWTDITTMQFNFLDHLLREGRSNNLTPIRRSFYSKHPKFSQQLAFWNDKSTLHAAAVEMLVRSDLNVNTNNIIQQLKPIRRGSDICMSQAFQMLRRLERTKFTIAHGKADKDKIYTVGSIFFNAESHPDGADATNVSFTKQKEDGSSFSSTVEEHFIAIGKPLEHPKFPLIKLPHGEIFFPFEVCFFAPMQRYTPKLLPDETQAMIKAAISNPWKRQRDISNSARELKLDNDAHLKAFGVTINTAGGMQRVTGKILSRPTLEFSTKLNINDYHRWDLRGIKFFEGKPLKYWMVINCDFTKKPEHVDRFLKEFVKVYNAHAGGGSIVLTKAIDLVRHDDLTEQRIKATYERLKLRATNNQPKMPVQMVFFFLPKKNIKHYNLIKKVMDCDLKVLSQVVTWEKIDDQKSLGQYCGNVALKVNAKLGGTNCYARPTEGQRATEYFPVKTMFIGLDVSHGAAGTNDASMAALTVSIDRRAVKYGAACQTNGIRTEIVCEETMKSLLPRFIQRWRAAHDTLKVLKGGGPEHLYFFRDGVDAGQFREVLATEVQAIRETFIQETQACPKITVVIVTKRHHIRMFNADANKKSNVSHTYFDKNDNPKPGLLVEVGATHPEYWDFFLTSHNAIQGTSRPIHYQVILNEIGCQPNGLQRMIFHHCYQYCRSTLPVSIHPAVQYAHVVSKRAAAHLQPPALQTAGQLPAPRPLLSMREPGLSSRQTSTIEQTMWFA
ncbi:eukaryotic translation initiation factor 2C 2 [Apiospora sp. TS-2023a]